ncbi:MAG: thioredoxin [Candidatus Omnitrophica bacterium]|nr:thioredoxin [Candidatus Omnitrophota bacterium]
MVVTDANFKKEVLQTDKTVLVDFWASWCMPCKILSPIIDKIAEDYKDRLKVCKLNIEDSPRTASAYGIMSMPTVAVFKEGKILTTASGTLTKEEIESKFKPHL